MDKLNLKDFEIPTRWKDIILTDNSTVLAEKINEIIDHLQGRGDSNAQPTQDRDCEDCTVRIRHTSQCGHVHWFVRETPNSNKGDSA